MPGDRGDEAAISIRAQTRTARHQRLAAAIETRRLERRRRAKILAIWAVVSTIAVVVTALIRGVFDPLELVFFASTLGTIAFASFSGVLARPLPMMERQALAGADAALALDHLPPRVAELARETRALRLAVEAADPADAAIDAWVWSWIRSVRELGPEERELIAHVGISTHDVEAVLLGEALDAGPADGPVDNPALPARRAAGRGPRLAPVELAVLVRRVELLAEHFEAFEVALLRYRPGTYRGS
ncbi:hypothetical protein OV090_30085 [Nannocystis sp. RBIL2]|uniref:hypothetical protein n=1 Tax=Nannocystis sp. RBIL2 TaxID=2996788 RepID=UPI00226EB171|nr:hypothetical protein [Nannocystis sp. RBIL2]MCY1069027.1 hypothetical protein [Nannocystis sp. RBIL2]